MTIYEEVVRAYDSIKDKVKEKPEIALILGSGLGDFANNIEDAYDIPYCDIEGFPVSTVVGHAGRFVFGKLGDKNVVVMQGRVHYYEGYSMNQVVMPIRLMHMLGAETLVLTNASGGINTDFVPGDLMMITDHITSFVPSPLIGKNIDEFGTRFPDMSNVYNLELQDKMRIVAKDLSIDLKEGVYLQTTGPSYETPAEIKMFSLLGASAVGMSTACEAMVAKHMGMKIAGVSCITNMASGISNKQLNHEEVGETAALASVKFTNLVKQFIISL